MNSDQLLASSASAWASRHAGVAAFRKLERQQHATTASVQLVNLARTAEMIRHCSGGGAAQMLTVARVIDGDGNVQPLADSVGALPTNAAAQLPAVSLSDASATPSSRLRQDDLVVGTVLRRQQSEQDAAPRFAVHGVVVPSADSSAAVDGLAQFAALVPGVPLTTALSLQECTAWSRLRMAVAGDSHALLSLLDQLCNAARSSSVALSAAKALELKSATVSAFMQQSDSSGGGAGQMQPQRIRDVLRLCCSVFGDPLTDSVAERAGCAVAWWRHKLLFASSPLFVTHVVAAFLCPLPADAAADEAFFTTTVLDLVSSAGRHAARVVRLFLDGGADASLVAPVLPLCREAAQALAAVAIALRSWRDSQQDTSAGGGNLRDPVVELPEHVEGNPRREMEWVREAASGLYLLSAPLRAQCSVVDAVLRGAADLVALVGGTLDEALRAAAAQPLLSGTLRSGAGGVLATIGDEELGQGKTAAQLFARCRSAVLDKLHVLSMQHSEGALEFMSSQFAEGRNSNSSSSGASTSRSQSASPICGRLAVAHLMEVTSKLLFDGEGGGRLLGRDAAPADALRGAFAPSSAARQRFGVLLQPSPVGAWCERGIDAAVHSRSVLGPAALRALAPAPGAGTTAAATTVSELDGRLVLHGLAPRWLIKKRGCGGNGLGLLTVCASGHNIWLIWFTVAAVLSGDQEDDDDDDAGDDDDDALAPAALAVNLLLHDAALVHGLMNAAEMSRELLAADDDNAGSCCVFFRSRASGGGGDVCSLWGETTATNAHGMFASAAPPGFVAPTPLLQAPQPKDALRFVRRHHSVTGDVVTGAAARDDALRSMEHAMSFALTANQRTFVHAVVGAADQSASSAYVVAAQGASRCGRSTALRQAAATAAVLTTIRSRERQEAEDALREQHGEGGAEDAARLLAAPTPAELRQIMTAAASASEEDGASASSAPLDARLAARHAFLLRVARVQHGTTVEDAPTLLLVRCGDVGTATHQVSRLVDAALHHHSSSSTSASAAAAVGSIDALLDAAVARCSRAPFVQRRIDAMRAAIEQLAEISAVLATSRGMLSAPTAASAAGEGTLLSRLFAGALSPAQLRCFQHGGGGGVAPALLQALQRAREDSEQDGDDGGLDRRLAADVEAMSVRSGFALAVLPLPAVGNSSDAGGGSEEDGRKLAADIALLARTDFGRSNNAAMPSAVAESCVAAIRYRILAAVHRERGAVFGRLRALSLGVRDFVESTAVQALRSLGGGRVVVADERALLRHGASLLAARIGRFRAVLVDDADALLGASPLLAESCAGRWMLRPLLVGAWGGSQQRHKARGDAPIAPAFAAVWNPRACLDQLRCGAVFNLSAALSSNCAAGGRLGAEPLIIFPLQPYLCGMIVASLQEQQQQQQQQCAKQMMLYDDGIAQDHSHGGLFALRRSILRETLALEQLQIQTALLSQQQQQQQQQAAHLFAAVGQALHSPSQFAGPLAHFTTNSTSRHAFARSLVRPVSVWAVPSPSASGTINEFHFFVRAVSHALDHLADLAPSNNTASSPPPFHVAFVSERGNLLAFDVDSCAVGGSAAREEKWCSVVHLAAVPSTVESLVLVVVPQPLLCAASAAAAAPAASSAAAGTQRRSFFCVRSVSDASAAAQLLHRAAGAVVCISTAAHLQLQESLCADTARAEQQAAEIIAQISVARSQQQQQPQQPQRPVNWATTPGGRPVAAALASLWQRTEPWMRALLRTALECRGGDAAIFSSATSCFGPALEVCCPRHQQQARGFLLLTTRAPVAADETGSGDVQDDVPVYVRRLLPSSSSSSASARRGGLFGTCSLVCLAKYGGASADASACTVRAHMCLSACHEGAHPDAHGDDAGAAADAIDALPASFHAQHVGACPFPCTRRLACGHGCGLECGAAPCSCVMGDAPVVVLERACGEMCIVGVDGSKEPLRDFYCHRVLVPCNGAGQEQQQADENDACAAGASTLPPCMEPVEIECGRCSGAIQCACSEQAQWLWSDALALRIERQQRGLESADDEDGGTHVDPSSFYFRCADCRTGAAAAVEEGPELDKIRLRNRMLAKRTALLAARDGAATASERVRFVLQRREELRAQSEAALQAVAERVKANMAENVARAKKAFAKQDQTLTTLAADRARFMQEVQQARGD